MDFIEGIIVKAIDGFYYVSCDEKEYICKSRKKFRFNDIAPKVGDNVSFKITDKFKSEGVIEKIHERTSDFIRPQLSNLTQAFIVATYIEPKINIELINKMIFNFEICNNIKICFVINKCDLYNSKCEDELKELFLNFPYEIIFVSTKNNVGVDLIKGKLKDNISCFCGASGVGKSSLLNSIANEKLMGVSSLSSKIKRGRHTTRFSQLIYLKEFGGYLVDTPGFTSMEISNKIHPQEYKNYFPEFYNYNDCKFRGCIHVNEIGCSVKKAVHEGKINKIRYDFYVKIFNEFCKKRK